MVRSCRLHGVRLVPFTLPKLTSGMYLFNSLDRNAASNAKSDGMTSTSSSPPLSDLFLTN